jgi:hypothetical protein
MGTSPERVMTDKLGRRSGPRRQYSLAEKRSMVEETRQPGASVPEVAQRHGVNANCCLCGGGSNEVGSDREHGRGLPDPESAWPRTSDHPVLSFGSRQTRYQQARAQSERLLVT